MTDDTHSYVQRVALFRAEVIGALTRRELVRGEFKRELEALSEQRFRPPLSKTTRTFAVSTLQRWYYDYRRGGLAALEPKPRRDRGHGRGLTDAKRKLILDIARENPFVSATLIHRTLLADGRLRDGEVSAITLRRLLREHRLDRRRTRREQGEVGRLRWQVDTPNLLWHGDVCHGPALTIEGRSRKLRIHALLDDASRYVLALEAHHTETEMDMLGLFARAVRRHGAPGRTLYLDNGSTYSGKRLLEVCAKLKVTLVHAAPYDPQARGKMERFWRTLREQVLDHMGTTVASLHDVNVRLCAWLDTHYHRAHHAGLMGKSPGKVWAERSAGRFLDEEAIRDAFTERKRRRLRGDSTLSIRGTDYELTEHFARSGKTVTVAHCLLDASPEPWVEHEDLRVPLRRVDAVANSKRGRSGKKKKPPKRTVSFDPAKANVDEALHRGGEVPR